MLLGTHLDHNFIQLTGSDDVTVEIDYSKILCMRPYKWSTWLYIAHCNHDVEVKESVEDIKKIAREKQANLFTPKKEE